MAALVFWCQNIYPNWKVLFCITIAIASARTSGGMLEKWCSCWWMKQLILIRAAVLRMLVYMLVASEMKRRAPVDRSNGSRRSTRALLLRR